MSPNPRVINLHSIQLHPVSWTSQYTTTHFGGSTAHIPFGMEIAQSQSEEKNGKQKSCQALAVNAFRNKHPVYESEVISFPPVFLPSPWQHGWRCWDIFSSFVKKIAQIPPQHVILWKYQQRHLNKKTGLKYELLFVMDVVSCSSHVGPWNKAIKQKVYRTHPLKSLCCNHFKRMPQGWCPNIPIPLNFRAFKKSISYCQFEREIQQSCTDITWTSRKGVSKWWGTQFVRPMPHQKQSVLATESVGAVCHIASGCSHGTSLGRGNSCYWWMDHFRSLCQFTNTPEG